MLIFTPKYFFTLLAVKPGSNLQPCHKAKFLKSMTIMMWKTAALEDFVF